MGEVRRKNWWEPKGATGAAMMRHQVTTWGDLLGRRDIFVVDCETTGLGGSAEVIEIAMIDTTGEMRLESLVTPAGDWDAKAERAEQIHGISLEKLMDEGTPWPGLHDEIELLLRESAVCLAWNASFDRRMLKQSAKAWDLELPDTVWHDAWRAWGGGKLGAVPGVKHEDAHRAGGDVRAVLALMEKHPGTRSKALKEAKR